MVLVAGLGGVSLFALGYIVLAFWMLWQGNSLYLSTNYRRTLARWKLLMLYTVIVMLCKAALQVSFPGKNTSMLLVKEVDLY
ncbi:unnamed protein product [Gongylonema pulchrum]|uniref:Lysine transporter LysE n=1 Tax=Gongylonema pulchrum TaxID=637853 RepID=A0A183DA62_9BILA|nr:unnamed protein product [Gongylonema pulchrum]